MSEKIAINRTESLASRLSELADAYQAKPLTEGALRVWLDALKEFETGDILSALCDLPKRATRMPTPADAWKACADQRERRAERLRAERKQEAPRDRSDPATAFAWLATIREALDANRPRALRHGEALPREPGCDDV